ncbi:MAG: hypothetical protein Q4D95_02750 [Peptoniphilus sp.]|nr:hypothetical protein [Peptoniphilus sp.]
MIVVDKKINKEILCKLKLLDEVLLTAENNNLQRPINSHPDMLVRALEDKDVIVDRENYQYYKSALQGYNVIKSDTTLRAKYPGDIALNFCKFKNHIIHNLKYTDKKVLEYYSKRNYEFVDVKQGYTKCNIVVGENTLITSDRDIYDKLKGIFNILLIRHKEVILEGYEYGFIGGASGIIKGVLYFTGDIKKHSNGQKIAEFLNAHGEKYKMLSTGKLTDYGSVLEL